jgi:hypothetical protein
VTYALLVRAAIQRDQASRDKRVDKPKRSPQSSAD